MWPVSSSVKPEEAESQITIRKAAGKWIFCRFLPTLSSVSLTNGPGRNTERRWGGERWGSKRRICSQAAATFPAALINRQMCCGETSVTSQSFEQALMQLFTAVMSALAAAVYTAVKEWRWMMEGLKWTDRGERGRLSSVVTDADWTQSHRQSVYCNEAGECLALWLDDEHYGSWIYVSLCPAASALSRVNKLYIYYNKISSIS